MNMAKTWKHIKDKIFVSKTALDQVQANVRGMELICWSNNKLRMLHDGNFCI